MWGPTVGVIIFYQVRHRSSRICRIYDHNRRSPTGSTAISGAKAQASTELISFIKGNKSLTTQSAQQHLTTNLTDDAASLYEQQRTTMIEGLNAGAVPLNYSAPALSGNDTCMTVSLNPQELGEIQEQSWQQATQDISVTVIGQGWKKEGKTT